MESGGNFVDSNLCLFFQQQLKEFYFLIFVVGVGYTYYFIPRSVMKTADPSFTLPTSSRPVFQDILMNTQPTRVLGAAAGITVN